MTIDDSLAQAKRLSASLSLEQLCGQLLVVGFEGTELTPFIAAELRTGRCGGIILFRRNLPDLETTWQLCRQIREAFPPAIPAMIAVDEEGGRVSRLPAPFLRLPPMRWFGDSDDPSLTKRAASWLGIQLASLGFTWNFAPVLDVDSNPQNPIIGDRSFSSDPARVARHAAAFIAGLQEQGVAACGKHFPGHGDTQQDSHFELPLVDQSRQRLDAVELFPFRACAQSGLASVMTAHVVYPAIESDPIPATFSPSIVREILREQLGFPGLVFSDDLEMGAIAARWTIAQAARLAILAGCDALLVCRDAEAIRNALASLVEAARADGNFEQMVRNAAIRSLWSRYCYPPRQQSLQGSRTLIQSSAVSKSATELGVLGGGT